MVTIAPDATFRFPSESDAKLVRRVRQTLADLHVPILRTLDVSAADGVVTLRGRVRTYYERQLAHAGVKRIPGVASLVEEITVADPDAAIPLAIRPRFRVA
jgi:osmotically-inducible protein OsmY